MRYYPGTAVAKLTVTRPGTIQLSFARRIVVDSNRSVLITTNANASCCLIVPAASALKQSASERRHSHETISITFIQQVIQLYKLWGTSQVSPNKTFTMYCNLKLNDECLTAKMLPK